MWRASQTNLVVAELEKVWTHFVKLIWARFVKLKSVEPLEKVWSHFVKLMWGRGGGGSACSLWEEPEAPSLLEIYVRGG